MFRKVLVGMLTSALLISSVSIAQAAVTSGSKCRTLNQKEVVKSRVFICVKSGSKLVWQVSPAKKSNTIKKPEVNKSEPVQSSSTTQSSAQTSTESKKEAANSSRVTLSAKFISKPRQQWHSELKYDGILQLDSFVNGEQFDMVECASFVYDWGIAKNTAGMKAEQDSMNVELRIDTQNTNTLPRSVTLIDCPNYTQDPSEKNVPKTSFQFDWKFNNSEPLVSTKLLNYVIDLAAVKNSIPSFVELSTGQIRWAETRSTPAVANGQKTGLSVVSFYVDYPFDICEGVFTDGSGRSLPAEMNLDRLNGLGSVGFKSPVKQTIGYKIACVKSGENSGIIEHTGWVEGRIKASK